MTTNLPVPVDVKLMNLTTSLLVTALVLGCVVAGVWWAMRNPVFAIGQITVRGDTAHNSAAGLRASVAPRLTGTFFTMDLAAAQVAFQAVPWVRRAVVQREFPNALHVSLQEHVPVARWGDDDQHMVNTFGEIFEADSGDADDVALPSLSGPDGRAAEVLAMYQRLAPLVTPLNMHMSELALLSRGNWRAEMDEGAVIELGQGTPEQLAARLAQFVATVPEVAARHQRPTEAIEAADLRHVGGYALRLKGVSTVRTDPTAKPTVSSAAPAARSAAQR